MTPSVEAIAFVPSLDLERSSQFFTDVLGLELRELNDFACVLQAGSTMLRVTRVEQLTPHPFTVFGLSVPDIRTAAAGLAARGVEPLRYPGLAQDGQGIWAAPDGALVLWFHDPDRNVLSLTQFVAA
jgi:catechol 2,3-dioxygenase-like lactoylglutathione lyase family enzyme